MLTNCANFVAVLQNFTKSRQHLATFRQKIATLSAIFHKTFDIRERCKGVHCVDLDEGFPTSICYVPSFIFLFFSLIHVPSLSISFQIDPNSNEYFLAKFGFDTFENEPRNVCPLSAYRSPRSLEATGPSGGDWYA